MAGLTVYLAWIVPYHDRPGRSHWTGSHDFTIKVFELFAVIFILGLVAIGGGIFQLRRGRVSKPAAVVMFFLGERSSTARVESG